MGCAKIGFKYVKHFPVSSSAPFISPLSRSLSLSLSLSVSLSLCVSLSHSHPMCIPIWFNAIITNERTNERRPCLKLFQPSFLPPLPVQTNLPNRPISPGYLHTYLPTYLPRYLHPPDNLTSVWDKLFAKKYIWLCRHRFYFKSPSRRFQTHIGKPNAKTHISKSKWQNCLLAFLPSCVATFRDFKSALACAAPTTAAAALYYSSY